MDTGKGNIGAIAKPEISESIYMLKEMESPKMMIKKPCIYCGDDCDIFSIQLGDAFTLTYLRLCDWECFFWLTYDYLYSLGRHRDFRHYLYEKQSPEDEKEKDEFIKFSTSQFLEEFKKGLGINPYVIPSPIPEVLLKLFYDTPFFNLDRSTSIKLCRSSKEDKLKWAKEHVEKMHTALENALKDLRDIENE